MDNLAIPSILELIAADANVSLQFVKAIAIKGSERWNEVREQEAADHAADVRVERDEAGE